MHEVSHFIEAKNELVRLQDMRSILRVIMFRWTLDTGEKGIPIKQTNVVKRKERKKFKTDFYYNRSNN